MDSSFEATSFLSESPPQPGKVSGIKEQSRSEANVDFEVPSFSLDPEFRSGIVFLREPIKTASTGGIIKSFFLGETLTSDPTMARPISVTKKPTKKSSPQAALGKYLLELRQLAVRSILKLLSGTGEIAAQTCHGLAAGNGEEGKCGKQNSDFFHQVCLRLWLSKGFRIRNH